MLSFSNLVNTAKDVLRKGGIPLCKHEYVENGQIWSRIGKKKYQLKTRLTCKFCKDDRLNDIGDK